MKLWVKETYAVIWPDTDPVPIEQCTFEYRASTTDRYPGGWPEEEAKGNPDAPKWKSGRFMPKAAARIWLEVTDVRAERLQSISAQDCEAEGVKPLTLSDGGFVPLSGFDYVGAYRELWEKINKTRGYGWDSNPFVWCISFRRVER
jgi:hypothetical protein